jgi:cytidylate kinase
VGELLIVSGPPGAGKSTVAAAIADRREPSVLVDGDAFFGFLRRGRIDPWLPEAHRQNATVVDAAAAATAHFAHGPFWTVYDGVVGPWVLPSFMAAAPGRVNYAVLLPDVDVCVRRVVERDRHEFRDETAARHMHAQFAEADIAERHLIRDLTDAAQLADRIISRVDAGLLRVERTGP